MRKSEKNEIMSKTDSKLNKAKDLVAEAADILEENGLVGDAERLMKIVYRLEVIQNMYNEWSVYNRWQM